MVNALNNDKRDGRWVNNHNWVIISSVWCSAPSLVSDLCKKDSVFARWLVCEFNWVVKLTLERRRRSAYSSSIFHHSKIHFSFLQNSLIYKSFKSLQTVTICSQNKLCLFVTRRYKHIIFIFPFISSKANVKISGALLNVSH